MSFSRIVSFALIAGALVAAGCEVTGGDLTGPDDEPPEAPTIRMVSHLSLAPEGMAHSDVWGYVDPNTDKEYALVGAYGGSALFIVDVSDPTVPVHVSTATVPGFDMKVWQQYAYTVTGGGDRRSSEPEGRIVDLSDPANPVVVGSFPSSHNLFIDDLGYMYLDVPGLRIFDLNTDPLHPTLVWDDELPQGGHDATVIGNRLYDFHGRGGTHIYDVTNRQEPQLLGSITLPSIRYHHSGSTTIDGRYLFVCDELSRDSTADVTIWDIDNPANPVLAAEIGDDEATVHNLYVIDDLAFVSYYSAGFRLYDVSDPTQPRLIDEFDTAPEISGAGFDGAWGVYPFTPSGHIYVSDIENGLYVFALDR
jgi:hypothetical protein